MAADKTLACGFSMFQKEKFSVLSVETREEENKEERKEEEKEE